MLSACCSDTHRNAPWLSLRARQTTPRLGPDVPSARSSRSSAAAHDVGKGGIIPRQGVGQRVASPSRYAKRRGIYLALAPRVIEMRGIFGAKSRGVPTQNVLLKYGVARPTLVTPALQVLIESLRGPGLSTAQLHARVVAAGGKISPATLHRYLKRGPAFPAHMRAPAPYIRPEALLAQAGEALATDDVAELRQAKGAVAAAMRRFELTLGDSPKSVTSYRSLISSLRELTQAVAELTPKSAEDRYAPIESAAVAALLSRCEQAAKLDDDLRGRLQRQSELLDRLVDEGR